MSAAPATRSKSGGARTAVAALRRWVDASAGPVATRPGDDARVDWPRIVPFVALHVADDQETAVALFRRHDRSALPVVDGSGILVGIVTVDDVTSFCREHLAGYKMPRSIAFAEELPKTGSGKVLKRQLRDPYWKDSGRTL